MCKGQMSTGSVHSGKQKKSPKELAVPSETNVELSYEKDKGLCRRYPQENRWYGRITPLKFTVQDHQCRKPASRKSEDKQSVGVLRMYLLVIG